MSFLVYAMVRTINCLCDSRQKMARKTSPEYFTASFTKQYYHKRGTSYFTQGRRSGTCDYSQQEQRLNANRRKWFYWLSWKTDSSEEEIQYKYAKKRTFQLLLRFLTLLDLESALDGRNPTTNFLRETRGVLIFQKSDNRPKKLMQGNETVHPGFCRRFLWCRIMNENWRNMPWPVVFEKKQLWRRKNFGFKKIPKLCMNHESRDFAKVRNQTSFLLCRFLIVHSQFRKKKLQNLTKNVGNETTQEILVTDIWTTTGCTQPDHHIIGKTLNKRRWVVLP